MSILLYADDIILLAENENDLQSMLEIVENWCRKWRLEINLNKTNVMHVRKKRKPQSRFCFLLNLQPVSYCQSYKYLGVYINEFLDFNFSVSKQVDSAGRALGSIITKMIKNEGLPFNVYSLLYEACVCSISDYSAAVTGFGSNDLLEKLHLRALRAFLGVPKNTCNAAITSEFNLLVPKYRTKISMIRFYHRLMKMEDDRLTKRIYMWDRSLNESDLISSWPNEVKNIFSEAGLSSTYDTNLSFNKSDIIAIITNYFRAEQSRLMQQECQGKPKMRTFLRFKSFDLEEAEYLSKPLSFFQRRALARLRLGCLPLRIETGRFQIPRLPEEERICEVCVPRPGVDSIENECHFLFQCVAYQTERDIWYSRMVLPENFKELPLDNQLKVVLNEPLNLKHTANYVISAFNQRSKHVNCPITLG